MSDLSFKLFDFHADDFGISRNSCNDIINLTKNKMINSLSILSSDYILSAIRRGDITGENVYTNDSDVKRAQQWLRTNKVEGYVDDTVVNDAWIPNARGTKMDNDIFGDVLVDKKYFQRMFNDLHITNKEQQDKLLESLGIIPYEKQTTVQEDKKKLNYEWGTYYSVPITKVYNSGIIQGDRNLEFRKSRYGQTNAAAGERNSYAAGMQSTLIR